MTNPDSTITRLGSGSGCRASATGGGSSATSGQQQRFPQVRCVCRGYGLHSDRGGQLVPAVLINLQLPFHNSVAGNLDVHRSLFPQCSYP